MQNAFKIMYIYENNDRFKSKIYITTEMKCFEFLKND